MAFCQLRAVQVSPPPSLIDLRIALFSLGSKLVGKKGIQMPGPVFHKRKLLSDIIVNSYIVYADVVEKVLCTEKFESSLNTLQQNCPHSSVIMSNLVTFYRTLHTPCRSTCITNMCVHTGYTY